jgi:trehalose/maltose hydrolase-like predicted phosphorylase
VYEDHISSDIALAITQYWRMTRDNSGGWLNATAWPLLRGIARFWMSKLALDNPGAGAGDALHVKAVMGPDEYHYPVDDSAYTNAGVIQSLDAAVFVAAALGGGEGAAPGEVAAWADAAARVAMPWDAARQYHPEFAGYKFDTQVKQADTVLLGFPLEISFNMTPEVRANDLAAYGGKNTDPGGPAMTWGMFAIGYIELGPAFAQEAAGNFNRSFANVRPPFDVWTETPGGGCPNFLTGAGGFLQTAFNGYPGLRVNLTHATFHNPRLPEGATRVALRSFAYLGNRVTVAYDESTIAVSLAAPPSAAEVDAWAARAELRVAYAEHAGARAGRPLPPLSQRAPAVGRVPLAGGGAAAPQALRVVDSTGGTWALPVVLPLQTVSIVSM